MKLEGLWVRGFRSLASIDEITLGSPTILTGANDGGKTATIFALGMLLGESEPQDEDRTWYRGGEDPEGGVGDDGRYAETCVTGRFSLGEDEQSVLGLPGEVRFRRRFTRADGVLNEIEQEAPVDENLRDLSNDLGLSELRRRAETLGIEPDGPAGAKASFLAPLEALAAEGPKERAWVKAPRSFVDGLPRLLSFSSAREPNPEEEIATALRGEYTRLLNDETLVASLRGAEERIRSQLQDEADELRNHLLSRVPELTGIAIQPVVSFSGGFRGTNLLTETDGGGPVPLSAVGSGRRRRMTLAVWEWVSGVLARDDDRGQIIIAYDEPDTHLDYSKQRELVDLLRSQAAISGVQVVVATHSLNLIDKVDIRDVVHLALDSGRTAISSLSGTGHDAIDQHLAEVSAAMGLRNSVMLYERCFLGVEGASEAQALPILFHLVTGYSLQAVGIQLIPGNGNVGALRVAQYLNDRGRRVHFLVDADSARAPGARKVFRPDRLEACGISSEQVHMVGDPGDIEDSFSDSQWTLVCNDAWPRTDGRPWNEDDFRQLRSGDGFGKRLAVLVDESSSRAPSSKAGYLVALAERLVSRDEVPGQLADTLQGLLGECED